MTTAARPSRLARKPGNVPDRSPREISALRAWLRLLACSSIIERRVRASLWQQFDSTLPRFDVLAQLDAGSVESPCGLTMSELSRRLMVTNGNLTGLVERLAREGLVTRTTGYDRRAQLVSLSPEGKRSLDSMTPEHAEWIREMFAGLSDADCQELHALLGKLKRSALEHR